MLRFTMVLMLAIMEFGCQSSSSKADVSSKTHVRMNIAGEPQTLDPRKARDLKCQTIARMLFEGLARVGKDEKTQLALAQDVSISPDLKTYTFHLKDAVWSNGDPVTAEDFAYTWKKTLSPDFVSDTAFYLYPIKNAQKVKQGAVSLDALGVYALDEKTLVVELENPTPYFLELITLAPFFPVNHKIDQENPFWAQKADTYVGNGPFSLHSWKHHDCLHLKKNGEYWDKNAVQLTDLELTMVQEETELKLFEKKELDWAGSPLSVLPIDAIKALHKVQKKEILGTYLIRLNTERAPFNHPNIRKAFALAANRKLIVDHVTQGNQIPATGLVPLSLGLQQKAYFQDGDRETAKKLFEETLAESNAPLPEMTLMYNAGERNHLIAQALQQQWFEVFGIRIKLEGIEGKVYFDRLSKQDYSMASGSWIADFADPINFLEVFKYKKGGSNNTLWENAQYVALLDQSMQTADSLMRQKILADSEELLMREMPIIPIFHYTMLYVNQSYLQDVIVSSLGQMDFKWASIQEER